MGRRHSYITTLSQTDLEKPDFLKQILRANTHLQNGRRKAADHGPNPPATSAWQRKSISRETQRALFRALRPQPRLFPFLRRTDVLHRVHGEVHGGMEHGQQAVLDSCSEGLACGRWWFRQHVRGYPRTSRNGLQRPLSPMRKKIVHYCMGTALEGA